MLTTLSFLPPLSRRTCLSCPSPTSCRSLAKRYEPIETIEPFERYTAEGYYPVRIGDPFFSSRCYIVHKLGHGASSTIWLARDEHLIKYVAIKFAVSELDGPFESIIFRIMQDGKSLLTPEILDEFEVEGPEIQGIGRRHHCLVTTPARMNIVEARGESFNKLFQPLVARAIAAQLIYAAAFLYTQGIVHAGRGLE
jgi:serine/threonine-protein kinase SRPK3